jgi:hypothetical protein
MDGAVLYQKSDLSDLIESIDDLKIIEGNVRDVHWHRQFKYSGKRKADAAESSGSEYVDSAIDDDDYSGPSRRSTRKRTTPIEYWRASANSVEVSDLCEPSSYSEAMSDPDQAHWCKAVRAELKSMAPRGVFRPTKLPTSQRAIGTKWVFKIKRKADGAIDKYKTRLVAKGFKQQYGVHYTETFAPVVKYVTLCMMIAIAKLFGWPLDQLDVVTAFFYGLMKELMFMQIPEGVEVDGEFDPLELLKSIYGLKQASRVWNETFDEFARSINFTVSEFDPCLYLKTVDGECVLMLVYVDNVILTGSLPTLVAEVKSQLKQRFEMADSGRCKFVLGIELIDHADSGVTLCQRRYIDDNLKHFNMAECKSAPSPVDVGAKLLPSAESGSMTLAPKVPYRKAVGALMHLMYATRSDIVFAVGMVARFMENLQDAHWTAVKRIFRYLQGTKTHGIHFARSNDNIGFEGYSDADWAGDVSDQKSTSGYLFNLADGAISWGSKKQTSAPLSTSEAEYAALSLAFQESK